jgi:hypothetical protein
MRDGEMVFDDAGRTGTQTITMTSLPFVPKTGMAGVAIGEMEVDTHALKRVSVPVAHRPGIRLPCV